MFAINYDISDDVQKAQEDEEYLNKFIQANKRFIMVSAFKATKRFQGNQTLHLRKRR